MSWPLLQALVGFYLLVIVLGRKHPSNLVMYIWSAFGLAFLVIHLSLLLGWDKEVSQAEALQVQSLMAWTGRPIAVIDDVTLLVPDSTGWSGLNIGIECSTLIEMSVFWGLMLFYPRLAVRRRWLYLGIGTACTYGMNLIRILTIVLMIEAFGKPIVPLAHTVVARLVYFVGVIGIYWFLLTRPTLSMVRRSVEASGRGVY